MYVNVYKCMHAHVYVHICKCVYMCVHILSEVREQFAGAGSLYSGLHRVTNVNIDHEMGIEVACSFCLPEPTDRQTDRQKLSPGATHHHLHHILPAKASP